MQRSGKTCKLHENLGKRVKLNERKRRRLDRGKNYLEHQTFCTNNSGLILLSLPAGIAMALIQIDTVPTDDATLV